MICWVISMWSYGGTTTTTTTKRIKMWPDGSINLSVEYKGTLNSATGPSQGPEWDCMKVHVCLWVYLRCRSLPSCSPSLFKKNGDFRVKIKFFLCLSVNDCEGRESLRQTGTLVSLMHIKQMLALSVISRFISLRNNWSAVSTAKKCFNNIKI